MKMPFPSASPGRAEGEGATAACQSPAEPQTRPLPGWERRMWLLDGADETRSLGALNHFFTSCFNI